MTGNMGLFTSFNTSVQSKIKLGNDNTVVVNGKRKISVFSKNGEHKIVDEVFLVHGLKCNLLSFSQLTKKKYTVFFKNTIHTIYDIPPSKKLIGRVEMKKNKMFPLIMRSGLGDFMYACS